ncbi:MAG: DMT family transporter [Chlamydiia bacterium]|nr:DMT family transporter [Chlamydiia bacterium]
MRLKHFLGILLLALMWSPTFLLVKVGLQGFGPFALTLLRCLLASAFIVLLSLQQGPFFPYLKQKWRDLAFAGLIGNALPFALCAIGEVHVTSALAGIIEGMVPLFTLLLARALPPFHRLHSMQLAGVTLGFIGLLAIFLPGMWDPAQASQILKDLWCEVTICGMAIFFALSFIFAKERLADDPPLHVMAGQMLFASFWLFPFALFEEPVTPNLNALNAVLILAIFCTAFPWLWHYVLLRFLRASDIALAAYFIPIGSIALGYCFLNEILLYNDAVGAGLILFAMALAGGLIPSQSVSKMRRFSLPNDAKPPFRNNLP